jgi:hypothetical protein
VKTTSTVTLITAATAAGILGAAYGIFQVNHGSPLPVAHPSSLATMPAIAIVLLALAYPVYRYRKTALEYSKALAAESGPKLARPKRLDPFYAVRVLLLAKATSVTGAVIAGFHIGLVILQLSTPVIAANVWLNVLGAAGAIFALVVGLVVERICKIPDSGVEPTAGEATA